MARQTRDWTAIEHTDFTGGNRRVTVSGEVETLATNETPVLAEAEPQGINPAILILDLRIETSGAGNDVLSWQGVEFSKPCSNGQYAEVTIRNEDVETTVRVHKVIS